MRFVGKRLESSRSVKNKSTVISYLQGKKHASCAKRLNWKMKQEIVAVVAEKFCFHRYLVLFKSSVSCWKTHCLVKVRSCNRICAFTSMGSSLAENARIDEQLANAREGVYTFRVEGTCHRVSTLLPFESSTTNSAQPLFLTVIWKYK
jgi:hypothetical protein